MTREHLTEDIRNVLSMARPPIDAANAERTRAAFRGLLHHVQAEPDAPERVTGCLAESVRVLESAGDAADEDTWDYARTCLEAALDFAQARSAVEVPPPSV
jgi:hypothetical protein